MNKFDVANPPLVGSWKKKDRVDRAEEWTHHCRWKRIFLVAYKVARGTSVIRKKSQTGCFFPCLFTAPRHTASGETGENFLRLQSPFSAPAKPSFVFYPQPSATGTLAKARSTPNTNDLDKLGLYRSSPIHVRTCSSCDSCNSDASRTFINGDRVN